MIIRLFDIDSNSVIDTIKNNAPIILEHDLKFFDDILETKVIIKDGEKFREDGGLSQFATLFKDNIYAYEDIDIFSLAARYLIVRNKKISVVELGSCGKLISNLCKTSKAINYIDESYSMMSNISISKLFDISEKNLKTTNRVSFQNVFEITSNLRQHTMSDIVISNMTVLEENYSDTEKSLQPLGLTYISIGDRDDIYTKKYIFSGNQEEIIEGVAKMTCFLLINKLK